MNHALHSGGSVILDLASLRAEHRSTTRRYVIKTIFVRSSWIWRIGLLAIAGLCAAIFLTLMFVLIGPGSSSSIVGAGIGAMLALLTISIELSASAVFKDRLPSNKQRVIPFDLRLRTLRYLLFKERAEQCGMNQKDRLNAVFEIDREERNLDRFALERHPVYLLIAFVCLTLISSATGHFPIWTNGVGPTLAVIFGVLFALWLMLRKPIAAIFLTPGYRNREFGLFLKMLATDMAGTDTD